MKYFILCLFLATLSSCATEPGQPPELAAKKEELKKIAITAKQKGDFTQAANLENQIISLDIKDENSFINLSKTLKKQGKRAESLDILQTGEKLIPNNEKLQLATASALIENDRAAEAITKLESIKTLRNREYYNALGVANDLLKKHETAQDTFEEGLEIAPGDDLLLNNLALSYILSHEPEKGIEILKDLVENNPKPKYRQNLALAYGVIAKPDEARKLLLKDMSKKEAEENLKTYKQIKKEQ